MSEAKKPTTLDALALQADQIDSKAQQDAKPEGQAQEPQPEAAPAPTNAQVIAGALAMGREVFCAVSKLQSPRFHLNDEAVQQLGAVWGPVCDKHGWDLNAAMGDWGIEIAALVVTAQIGLTLRAAVVEEIAARNAKPVQAETVGEGEPVHHGV